LYYIKGDDMFVVYDNNKPARYPEHNVHYSWQCNTYDTFEQALSYARKWLWPYGEGVVLKLNKPWDYSGYGDMIEIREE
jgi:hypothetical protein